MAMDGDPSLLAGALTFVTGWAVMMTAMMLPSALPMIALYGATQPIYFDNVGHPAASRLAQAKASRSHMHAFGIDWDDTAGGNNGHFAPFSWSSS